jgi:hypothetical protein
VCPSWVLSVCSESNLSLWSFIHLQCLSKRFISKCSRDYIFGWWPEICWFNFVIDAWHNMYMFMNLSTYWVFHTLSHIQVAMKCINYNYLQHLRLPWVFCTWFCSFSEQWSFGLQFMLIWAPMDNLKLKKWYRDCIINIY